MFTSISRIIKSGWASFWRNKWLSSAAVLVMSLTIFGITSLILVNVLINSLTATLEDKIDISVYFKIDAKEDRILEIKEELAQMSEVESVVYVSREDALRNFEEKHGDDEVLMQSLQELETNPLEASLNIKAEDPSQYESIASYLSQNKYQDSIDKVNYLENKAVIERLTSITQNIRKGGAVVLLVLAFLAIVVTFNTIRLTIYTSKEEIKVMKLVGASNWFIRGPFIIEGALYGIVAAVIVLLVMFPFLWYLTPKIAAYLPSANILQFFKANLLSIFLFQVGIGVVLGMLSSAVAIRIYLTE
jgi:cell division transport system permease protein